jgi:hypothetical protein
MKLWFEGWNVNADHASISSTATPAVIAARFPRNKTSCDEQAAGRQCRQQFNWSEETPHGFQYV